MNKTVIELRNMMYMMVMVVVMYVFAYVMYYGVHEVVAYDVDRAMGVALYAVSLLFNLLVVATLVDVRIRERRYNNNRRIMKSDVKGGAYYW